MVSSVISWNFLVPSQARVTSSISAQHVWTSLRILLCCALLRWPWECNPQWQQFMLKCSDLAPEASQQLIPQVPHLPFNGSLHSVSQNGVAAKLDLVRQLLCIPSSSLQQCNCWWQIQAQVQEGWIESMDIAYSSCRWPKSLAFARLHWLNV